jgi:CHAT domain-containing protein
MYLFVRAELLVAFHRSLKSGKSPAEALREAALQVNRDKRYQHPFYRGGFVALEN